ncbi:MAG: thioredoxin family protein [Bacteroidales bacterium]|nr:thioredoxin family protein [Bacteroidales bacterium]
MACRKKIKDISKAARLLICCFIAVFLFAPLIAQEEEEYDYYDPQTWLLGDFRYNDLLRTPHDRWFDREFENYSIDDQAFGELAKKGLEDMDIVVVLGTWCSDSRREVPRFMKILESLGYDREKLRFIGVDSYKEAPIINFESFDIERVPTFIFYQNKIELGRIIEYPETSLERDMLGIVNKRD